MLHVWGILAALATIGNGYVLYVRYLADTPVPVFEQVLTMFTIACLAGVTLMTWWLAHLIHKHFPGLVQR